MWAVIVLAVKSVIVFIAALGLLMLWIENHKP